MPARSVPDATVERSASHVSEIVGMIEEDVLSGRLMPGDRLDERKLAARFGVSRTPVREALQRLAASKIIVLQSRQGATVAQLTIPDLLDAFIVIAELEALAAALAARRLLPDQRTTLEEAHADCARAAEAQDEAAFNTANDRFHAAIMQGSQNRTLQAQIREVQLLTAPYRRRSTFQPGRMATSVREHQAIVDAILASDAAAAAITMRQHVNLLAQDAADFIHNLRHSFSFTA